MAIRMIRKPSSLEEVGQITESQFNSGTYCVLVNGSMVLENEYIIAKTYNASTKYFRVIGEQVNNIDDIIPMRYAYSNQNGYVIGKGTELSYTISGLTFIINSGRIVLQGVESDIDANGISLTIDNVASKRYFSVYYEVNLGTNTVVIDSVHDTAGYPAINGGQDLTTNTNGTARMELYRFETLGNTISNVSKIVAPILYTQDQIDNLIQELESGQKVVKKTQDYDPMQGTIKAKFDNLDTRLTNLGFKKASIQVVNSNYIDAENTELYALGEVLYGTITIKPFTVLRYTDATTKIIAKVQNWIAYDKGGNNIGTLGGNAYIPSKRLKHQYFIRNYSQGGGFEGEIEVDILLEPNNNDDNNLVIKLYHDYSGNNYFNSSVRVIQFVIDNFQNKVIFGGLQE